METPLSPRALPEAKVAGEPPSCCTKLISEMLMLNFVPLESTEDRPISGLAVFGQVVVSNRVRKVHGFHGAMGGRRGQPGPEPE